MRGAMAEEEQKGGDLDDQFKVGLSWDSSNHFNLVVVEDGSVMFIYRKPDSVPESVKKLIYIQSNTHAIEGP